MTDRLIGLRMPFFQKKDLYTLWPLFVRGLSPNDPRRDDPLSAAMDVTDNQYPSILNRTEPAVSGCPTLCIEASGTSDSLGVGAILARARVRRAVAPSSTRESDTVRAVQFVGTGLKGAGPNHQVTEILARKDR